MRIPKTPSPMGFLARSEQIHRSTTPPPMSTEGNGRQNVSDITRAEFNELKNKVNEIFDDQKTVIEYIERGSSSNEWELYSGGILRKFDRGEITYYEAIKCILHFMGVYRRCP